MRRALFALLWLLAGAGPAAAQGLVTLPGHTYAPGAFRVLSTGATGCPLTSCVPLSAAPADDGTWCVCSSGGAWVAGSSASALQAHLDDTTAAHAASAILFSPGGLTYLGADQVQGALEDVDAQLGFVHAAAADAQDTADAAVPSADLAATTATPGAGLVGVELGVYSICGAATTQQDFNTCVDDMLGTVAHSLYIAPGEGGVGTLSNMTASLPAWDATDRLPCITFTASADSATGQFGWSMILPEQFTAWGPTSVLLVALQFSDVAGNNAASLTCKGTDGATALDAVSLTPSALFGWVAVATGSLEVGEAHAAGGIFSCLLTVTADTADTVQVCGALATWTH